MAQKNLNRSFLQPASRHTLSRHTLGQISTARKIGSILSPLAFTIASIAISTSVKAATYYVSPNGNNNNAGTKDKPLASIQTAIDRAVAGDTIYLRGGVHKPENPLWMGNVGKANARITMKPYAGEKAIIDGEKIFNSNSDYPSILSIGGGYIDIQGLEIRNSPSLGINLWRANNIRLLNNRVHNNQDTGIGIFESSDVIANNNTVYRSSAFNQPRTIEGGWGSGIAAGKSTRITLNSNLVYENYGEGIACILSDDCRAANNVVYDNYSVEMYFDNATNSSFSKNFIYNTGNRGFFRNLGGVWQPASGIQMANESYATSNPLNNNIVRNNIVVGGGWGFFYGSYQNGGGLKNTKILNNTFYGAANDLLFINRDLGHQNSIFANNIFYQTGGKPLTFIEGSIDGIDFTHNLWFGNTPDSIVTSPKDIFANPLLFNAGGLNASDYRLKANSPAINKGKKFSIVVGDYFKQNRSIDGFYDIGAHEYNSTNLRMLDSFAALYLGTSSFSATSTTPNLKVPEPSTTLSIIFVTCLSSIGYSYKRKSF
jgi:parallel beta-helix repeat protein